MSCHVLQVQRSILCAGVIRMIRRVTRHIEMLHFAFATCHTLNQSFTMMLSTASRQLRHVGRRATFVRRGFVTASNRAAGSSSAFYWMAAAGAITMTAASTLSIERTYLDAPASLPGPVEEAKTGILFPPSEGLFSFVGCGVRVKYGFVKVCRAWPYLSLLSILLSARPNSLFILFLYISLGLCCWNLRRCHGYGGTQTSCSCRSRQGTLGPCRAQNDSHCYEPWLVD